MASRAMGGVSAVAATRTNAVPISAHRMYEVRSVGRWIHARRIRGQAERIQCSAPGRAHKVRPAATT